MKVFGRTDRGLVRENNEDSILAEPNLCIVADGMGGHLAGEIASRDAITCANEFIGAHEGHDRLFVIAEAVRYANKYIFNKAQREALCQGMGTTLTLASVAGDKLFYAHVGDSRLYLFRNAKLERITADHSFVAQLLASGQITPEEAAVHPSKNVITKAVGAAPDIAPDTGCVDLLAKDVFLVCSDGLTNMLTDEAIAEIIGKSPGDPEEAAVRLIDAANAAGGFDNISVICMQY
ncbi:MAG: Stp1/IreP family PP2C-type Ser/Thr phosphatase [Acidaminococcales bacterium]|jgi:protein phosphatase|nr:Stp1/IreP family PP2C-type Ser/Thr phosphatase [Acidaminococcales bacterium]